MLRNETDIRITDDQRQELDRPLTIDEIYVALKGLAKNKTPGCDGLTVEFFVHFWEVLSEPLYNAYLCAKKKHLSARHGIITLIP